MAGGLLSFGAIALGSFRRFCAGNLLLVMLWLGLAGKPREANSIK